MKRLLILVIALLAFSNAYSDVIYLKSGDIIEGQVKELKDGNVFVQHKLKNDITVKFSLTDVKNIDFTTAQQKDKIINDKQKEIYSLNMKLAQAENDYRSLQNEYSIFRLKKEKPYKEYIDEISNLKYELRVDSDMIRKLKAKTADLTDNIESMKESLQQEIAKNADLRKNIAGLKKALEIVQTENKNNSAQIDDKDALIFQLKAQAREFNDSVALLLQKIEHDSDTIYSLSSKYQAEVTSSNKALEEIKAKTEDKIKQLKEQLNDALLSQSQKEEEYNLTINTQKSKIAALDKKVSELKKENKHLKYELSAARKLNKAYLQAIKKKGGK